MTVLKLFCNNLKEELVKYFERAEIYSLIILLTLRLYDCVIIEYFIITNKIVTNSIHSILKTGINITLRKRITIFLSSNIHLIEIHTLEKSMCLKKPTFQ